MSSPPAPSFAAFAQAVRAKIARDIEREHEESARLIARIVPAVAAGIARARREGLCGSAWLFGSYAWGNPTERSDVDVLLEDCRDPSLAATVIAEACGGLDVHAVVRERAPESLVRRALEQGKPL